MKVVGWMMVYVVLSAWSFWIAAEYPFIWLILASITVIVMGLVLVYWGNKDKKE